MGKDRVKRIGPLGRLTRQNRRNGFAGKFA